MSIQGSDVREKNLRFYNERVAPMIREQFPEYEDRIAVGIAGEGSDCFGYDDEISRDHDFGTGVCLWLTEEDMAEFGRELSAAYQSLVEEKERSYYTQRLSERRGVMTIHDFYSDILQIDCDVERGTLSDAQWLALDHTCLATAVNGEVFRDDPGVFTRFRNYLLSYYPDRVWRIRIAEQMHIYSSSLQVNYARCMARGDSTAAELCRAKGLEAAMELYFLLKRVYPPYYKWTFRALSELDQSKEFSSRIQELAELPCSKEAWKSTKYHPNRQNYKDRVVSLAEDIGHLLSQYLKDTGFVRYINPYLEADVNKVLSMDTVQKNQ